MQKTYGRTTIKANYTEKELLSLDEEAQKLVILSELPQIIDIHNRNKQESNELWRYYLGEQDVLDKIKRTRVDINNKKVENWAYAMVDFKKAWLLGKPIQYTMLDSSSSKEIQVLNQYCGSENKAIYDQLLYEDVLVVGRGFRYTQGNSNENEDEAPFKIANIDNDKCEVVYSSKILGEQLFSVVETNMIQYLPKKNEFGDEILDESGNPVMEEAPYEVYDIYLRNKVLTISNKTGAPEFIDSKPIVLNAHLITEYYVNRNRISLIEIGKDLFDGINQLESLDFDDMEQFVNAIMVFTNADIDKEGLESIQEFGAVKIKSTENRKASVELLQQRLNAMDTQVFYTRLITAVHSILGIPMQSDNGTITSGDTGRGKLVGQGFTSAGIRIQTDETALKACDKNALKVILKICREKSSSKIKKLNVLGIDIQIDMDKSENLLVKTQALQTLLSAGIPKQYSVPVVNLFSDNTAVVKDMEIEEKENEKKFGEEQEKAEIKNNIVNKINEDNNKVRKTLENQEQNN